MRRYHRHHRQSTAPIDKPQVIVSGRATALNEQAVSPRGSVGVIYVGPSVEGGDKEYVKVLTGDVDWRLPSFV